MILNEAQQALARPPVKFNEVLKALACIQTIFKALQALESIQNNFKAPQALARPLGIFKEALQTLVSV